ncbi:MAG: GNAT family N-acetyltransferase [Bdellovibrionales bacterium]
MTISIEILTEDNADVLKALVDDIGLDKDSDYVSRSVDKSVDKKRLVFIARFDDQPAGFCMLNFEPAYAPFQKFDIPEMQDLNTHPDFRRRGVGGALIARCESVAKEYGATQLGLGVGLHAGYGNAHRLYVHKGFVPDGQGAVYDAVGVRANDMLPLDDDLCLMMVKLLG